MPRQIVELGENEQVVIVLADGKHVTVTLCKIKLWIEKNIHCRQAHLGFDDPHKVSVWRKEKYLEIMAKKVENHE